MRNTGSHLLTLLVGIGVGGGFVLSIPQRASRSEGQAGSTSTVAVSTSDSAYTRVAELEKELAEYKARVSDAAKQIAAYEAMHTSKKSKNAHLPDNHQEGEIAKEGDSNPPSSTTPSDAAKWRISAIEKFVPLSEEQRERLAESYRAKSEGRKGETLDEILGNESAQYYREQVNSAFKRMRNQELEKEIVFTSRKLQLSQAQEGRLREIFNSIEEGISTSSSQGTEASPQERVRQMVEEGKRRAALRAEKTKDVLTPQQYQEFLKSEAESPEADMQVFHDSGE